MTNQYTQIIICLCSHPSHPANECTGCKCGIPFDWSTNQEIKKETDSLVISSIEHQITKLAPVKWSGVNLTSDDLVKIIDQYNYNKVIQATTALDYSLRLLRQLSIEFILLKKIERSKFDFTRLDHIHNYFNKELAILENLHWNTAAIIAGLIVIDKLKVEGKHI